MSQSVESYLSQLQVSEREAKYKSRLADERSRTAGKLMKLDKFNQGQFNHGPVYRSPWLDTPGD